MARRIPESWLSAYIDGELAADRASLVARFARKNPEVARQLDELRRIKDAVASLPKVKLAGENRRRIWDAVIDHPELKNAREAALSAQMDGELSLLQSAALEASFTDADLREAAKLAEVRDALRTLPKFIAPKDAVARAMEQIKIEAFEGAHAAGHLHELPQVPAPAGLLEDSISEMKPLASTYRVRAFRREGWATGLAAGVVTAVALFAYTWSPPDIDEGLVVNAPKPVRTAQPKVPVIEASGGLAAESPKVAPAPPRPMMKAPPLETAPLIDPDRFVEKKAPPPELPTSLVDLVRPGAKFEDPNTKFTFICLDVKKMANRVQLVLLRNYVGEGNIRTTKDGDGMIVSIEVDATPELMARVLSEIKDEETAAVERLIAEVRVAKTTIAVAQNEKRIRQSDPLANIRPNIVGDSANPPSANADPSAKAAADSSTKEPPALASLPADQPRQYVFVFNRRDLVPMSDPKKG